MTDWVSVIECMRLNIGYQSSSASSFIPSLLCERAFLVQRGEEGGAKSGKIDRAAMMEVGRFDGGCKCVLGELRVSTVYGGPHLGLLDLAWCRFSCSTEVCVAGIVGIYSWYLTELSQ